jgi:hypothetical protein
VVFSQDPRLEKDPREEVWEAWTGAVLLSNDIRYYATSPDIPEQQHLIAPFCGDHLRGS